MIDDDSNLEAVLGRENGTAATPRSMTTPEILPCPWCGSAADTCGAAVLCESEDCHAFGPDAPSKAAAIAAWNAVARKVQAHGALVDALKDARRYVTGAYECAFPDEAENEHVLAQIDAALALAGAE